MGGLMAHPTASAQLPDSCKLAFGTNLAGLSDYGAEQPFVDLMHAAREWYSKDVGNPDGGPFNTGQVANMSFLPNGYPDHAPQIVPGATFPQGVATIWAITSGWEAGSYTVLFEGSGSLAFWGACSNIQRPDAHTYTFDVDAPLNNTLEMRIDTSLASDPVQHIRVVNNIYLNTFENEPFSPVWLGKVQPFRSVRFMDWGHTNNWNQADGWEWDDPTTFDWDARAQPDHYTWTTSKGIPYEMMIKLMNDLDVDGWVCVPHTASDNYITRMAQLFHDQLEPGRHLTVEFSNETWNWMFGQAQWLNQYGCVNNGVAWPEGTVPYIQNCMDLWTAVYGADLDRLTRAVGVQTGWLDVAQRTANNMEPGSFDEVAGTYYFGIPEVADAELDMLGAAATVQDVAVRVRATWGEGKAMIASIRNEVCGPLGVPLAFYEGGQHLTPTPFGEEPTYAQALLDIQRDTAMYNLYTEWFTFLRTLQEGDAPLKCMNFSLISNRSARYGSWGIWETMFQDTAQVPAPKLAAIMENLHNGCMDVTTNIPGLSGGNTELVMRPNPARSTFQITVPVTGMVRIFNDQGRLVRQIELSAGTHELDCHSWPVGLYSAMDRDGNSARLIKQ